MNNLVCREVSEFSEFSQMCLWNLHFFILSQMTDGGENDGWQPCCIMWLSTRVKQTRTLKLVAISCLVAALPSHGNATKITGFLGVGGVITQQRKEKHREEEYSVLPSYKTGNISYIIISTVEELINTWIKDQWLYSF